MTDEIKNDGVIEEVDPAAKKARRRAIRRIVFSSIFVAAANMLYLLMRWIENRYDDVQFDQIFYQLKSPVEGTSSSLVWNAIFSVVFLGLLISALEVFLVVMLSGKLKDKLPKFKIYVKYCATRAVNFFKKSYLALSALALVLSIMTIIFRLGIHMFVYNAVVTSDFIEENYVDPDEVTLSFPEEKRNLIYIFLESMENTFSETSVGGNITDEFMSELTELANNNVSFSSKDSYGAYSYVGTRWTAAALFAQTSGVIIKVPMNLDYYGADGVYMPGITTLGDVLADEGYEQTVLFGSNATFAARDAYFTEHGNFNIIDLESLINSGKFNEEDKVWWGFEDLKLFDYAKEELTRLAAGDKPFNFMTLTADTHFPDGYKCDLCGDEYDNQYANVISCSSKQVYEFIEWIKAQPFYENTTIVLSGDHLTMDPEFLAGIDEDYVRTTYNCIINAAATPTDEKNREFGTFDMFPTTLAALGVEIEGDRLGIGTNLFSDVETLTEKYGYDKVEEELCKRSEFYTETFFDPDIKSKENE